MSVITASPPVKPFTAVFAAERSWIGEGLMAMNALLGGEPDILSPEFPVVETTYYAEEMGRDLLKVYASWPELMAPERLVGVKLAAMEWERRNSPGGRRRVNLDPGYVFSGGLVLSTAKFRGHRLPLGQGLWGELTLNYHQGRFTAFPWTYLDYQRPEVQDWLARMRRNYMTALKERV